MMTRRSNSIKVIADARRGHYVLRWADAEGKQRQKTTDLPCTGAKRQRETNRRKAGRLADELAQSLTDPAGDVQTHLAAYRESLEAAARAPKHVADTVERASKLCKAAKFATVEDFEARAVERVLNRWKAERNLAARTLNSYTTSLKSFANWQMADGQLDSNPFERIPLRNIEEDRRRIRRALLPDELRRLIEAASHGPTRKTIDGPTRAILYIVAAWTGLRTGELAEIRLRHIDLAADPPTIDVEAGYAKSRRRDTIPLHSGVVAQLREWIQARNVLALEAPIFNLVQPSGHKRNTAGLVKADLQDAREAWLEEAQTKAERKTWAGSDFLAYRDSLGRVADFHGLRHTYITNLAAADVPAHKAQKLARHSSFELTQRVYHHFETLAKAAEIEKLAMPPETQTATHRTTGPTIANMEVIT